MFADIFHSFNIPLKDPLAYFTNRDQLSPLEKVPLGSRKQLHDELGDSGEAFQSLRK